MGIEASLARPDTKYTKRVRLEDDPRVDTFDSLPAANVNSFSPSSRSTRSAPSSGRPESPSSLGQPRTFANQPSVSASAARLHEERSTPVRSTNEFRVHVRRSSTPFRCQRPALPRRLIGGHHSHVRTAALRGEITPQVRRARVRCDLSPTVGPPSSFVCTSTHTRLSN